MSPYSACLTRNCSYYNDIIIDNNDSIDEEIQYCRSTLFSFVEILFEHLNKKIVNKRKEKLLRFNESLFVDKIYKNITYKEFNNQVIVIKSRYINIEELIILEEEFESWKESDKMKIHERFIYAPRIIRRHLRNSLITFLLSIVAIGFQKVTGIAITNSYLVFMFLIISFGFLIVNIISMYEWTNKWGRRKVGKDF